MKHFIRYFKFFLVKSIILIQWFNNRVLKKEFSKDRLEILKHKLNFYSYNLKKRKALNVNKEYTFGINFKEKIFRIDINKITGFDGYYIYNGSAPLLKSAKEIIQNPSLKVNKSYLYKFYNDFQPKNYGELYKLNFKNSLYEVPSFLEFKPWINSFLDTKIKKGLFGPGDLNEIEHRLIRMKNIFKNIDKLGYLPSEKDIIKGYILISNDDYRFLITSGHHRVAVLKAINSINEDYYKKIIVAFEEKRSSLKIVDQKDVDKWPAVINNLCSKEEALELFKKFFST